MIIRFHNEFIFYDLKGQLQGHTAMLAACQVCGKGGKYTPCIRSAFVENLATLPVLRITYQSLPCSLPLPLLAPASLKVCAHFGKGAGARGGDGGECSQLFNKSMVNTVRETKIFNKWSLQSSDACSASRVRQTRGALRCDLATVLLS